jgi:hypothetical protein
VEALTKQNGVRLLGKFKKKLKKKLKPTYPCLSFYKKKPETHIFFFGLIIKYEMLCKCLFEVKLSCLQIDRGTTAHYLKPDHAESLIFGLHMNFLFLDFAARKQNTFQVFLDL